MNEEQKKKNKMWFQALNTVLYIFLYSIAEMVIMAIMIFQILHSLIKGSPNARLQEWGRAVSRYIFEIMLYVTYCRDARPFPFRDFPSTDPLTKSEQDQFKDV